MRIRPVGTQALLLDVADTATEPGSRPTAEVGRDVAGLVELWRAELWRRRESGELHAVEIVPAATTILLDGVPEPEATAERVATWCPRTAPEAVEPRDVAVPVTYDGADLPIVAGHWGVDVPEVVRRLSETTFRVAFCGFAPGFAYLTGLPPQWSVPRLDTPRPRVPAGSVALAGAYAGIYPTASPGGWLLVGRTDLALFDVHADPPATLVPGTLVRLAAA